VNLRLVLPMAAVVIVIWLVGTWVTKYSLGQMALYTPIAVVVVGATVGLVLLWVKVVMQLIAERRSSRRHTS
jgi:uncharacterized membrane protein